MNWRYILGSTANRFVQSVLTNQRVPLLRAVPYGLSWLYDIQRFNGGRKPLIIFDVGANIGQTAWGLVRYFPTSQIYCFEPVQSTFSMLRSNYGAYSNVCLEQLALGSSPGTAQITLHEFSEINTLAASTRKSVGTEKITVDTVDSYCSSKGISHIDILKMDVQGWEAEVLKGAEGMIESGKINFIFSEVGFDASEADMMYFPTLHETLTSKAYRFAGMYETYRYGRHKEKVGFASCLYKLDSDRK